MGLAQVLNVMPRKPNMSGACGLWWTVTTFQPRMNGSLGPHPDSSPHMDLTRQAAGRTLYLGQMNHSRRESQGWSREKYTLEEAMLMGTLWLGNIMLMGHLARRQHAHGTPWSGNTMDVGHHSSGMPCSTRVFTAQQPLTESLLPPHQIHTP